MGPAERFRFGDYTLERTRRRVLRRDGTALDLSPRHVDALQLLVDHAGELLDRDTLMRALWPGVVVEENSLSQVISALRRALGDDPQQPAYIQTVPRRGFRFVAPVTALPAAGATAVVGPAREGPGWPVQPDRRRWLAAASAGGLAASLGIGAWWWRRANDESEAARATTLAILPFRPLIAENHDELLQMGMADSLASRLSTVPGLVVRSSASVVRYRSALQDPLAAARELDAAYVVDGSLQRRDDRLRVTARLLRTSDGAAVWSGSFDEQVGSVFDVQDQISGRVAQALVPTLRAVAGGGGLGPEPGGTRSAEAYQLYLAAAWRSQDMRADSTAQAIALLEQALAIDPGYAIAWAQLGWVHRRKLWRTDTQPAEVFDAANFAVGRSLALVPDLPQGRAGLGFSRHMYEFDWPGSRREFDRALAANGNESSAHFGLGLVSMTCGRVDDGFEHLRLARELDPMSPVFHAVEASFLLANGSYDAARRRLDRAFGIAPQHGLAQLTLGMLAIAERRDDEATVALRRAVEWHGAATRPKAVLAMHLAKTGRTEEARAIRDELVARARVRYVPPTSIATVHAALGETGPALDALELGYRARDVRMVWLKDDPGWQALRGEPRYAALMDALGLDRYPRGLSPV